MTDANRDPGATSECVFFPWPPVLRRDAIEVRVLGEVRHDWDFALRADSSGKNYWAVVFPTMTWDERCDLTIRRIPPR